MYGWRNYCKGLHKTRKRDSMENAQKWQQDSASYEGDQKATAFKIV